MGDADFGAGWISERKNIIFVEFHMCLIKGGGRGINVCRISYSVIAVIKNRTIAPNLFVCYMEYFDSQSITIYYTYTSSLQKESTELCE